MTYAFGRISAALGVRVEKYYSQMKGRPAKRMKAITLSDSNLLPRLAYVADAGRLDVGIEIGWLWWPPPPQPSAL
jgi:hypothetical protein